jgi:hypothetical protein
MSSSIPGVRTEWGQVATKIAGDPNLTTPAWLTCLHTWFSLDGASYETAVLLDATLWGAIPLRGHRGMVEIPSVQRKVSLPPLTSAQTNRILVVDTRRAGRRKAEQILLESERRTIWYVLVPPTVARRVGDAWVLVRYGSGPAQRIAFLEGLHLTKVELARRRVRP